MSENIQDQEHQEQGETIPAQALEIHDKTKEAIASELGVDELTAEREVGEYFVDKVESDLQEGASQEELMTDVSAALISGSSQLEAEGGLSPNHSPDTLTEEAIEDNPVTELEETNPDLVTEGVVELAAEKKTSKFAEIVTLVTDKLATVANKIALRAVERRGANPAEASTEVSLEEAAERLEREGTVKFAPKLAEQMQDETRTNEIVYIAGTAEALGNSTSNEEFRTQRVSITEQAALQQFDEFIEEMEKSKAAPYREQAESLHESITFIGEKEYTEAAAGIAAYWKAELDKNESLTILAVTGLIARDVEKWKDSEGRQRVKSDDFLLEHVLSNFSDEELAKYGDRLIVDYDAEIDKNVKDLKVVLLDDWAVSGLQLRAATDIFTEEYPHRAKSIEIQLIAASEKRIKEGLMKPTPRGTFQSIPLRAYYTANPLKAFQFRGSTFSGAHVTGFHSSVDYDFEELITDMVKSRRESFHEEVIMPSLTNIVRPYRYDGINRDNFFVQRKRVEALAKQHNEERVMA